MTGRLHLIADDLGETVNGRRIGWVEVDAAVSIAQGFGRLLERHAAFLDYYDRRERTRERRHHEI